jgi:predicted dehydrogenase
MCTNVAEAEAMVAAADKAGTILMVAYMKRHEPAYQFAQARVREMSDVRFIQVNHLHPDNNLHTAEFKVHRFDDIPSHVRDDWRAEHARLVAGALGYPDGDALPDDINHAYSLILGSMIHDIGNLHGLFGPPQAVLSSEIWLEGRGVSTVLDYGDGKRAVCSWVDLPELWDFKETLEVYGSRERVLASFPTGFARGLPSYVTLHGMNADRTPWRQEYQWHDNPFKLELMHFGESIRAGTQPITTGRDAIADIQLVGDIVRTYLKRR